MPREPAHWTVCDCDSLSGNELSSDQQAAALARFVNRFTLEHKPKWAHETRPNGLPYMPQFASDAEWLANTRFAVTHTGRLHHGVHSCYSTPTWPKGQEPPL